MNGSYRNQMSEQRVFQSGGGASSQYTVRQTRTVTTSVRTIEENKGGNWTSVTQQTYYSDGGQNGDLQRTSRYDNNASLQQQFENLSIPETREKKTKKGFFTGFLGGKKETVVVTKPKPSYVSNDGFEKRCLDTHNRYRAKHGVPPLILSKELCNYASEWANKLAKEDKFQHRSNNKYGENIFMKWSSDPNHDIDGSDPVDDWYSEIKYHVFGSEPRSLKSGHFTQVIWEKSRELGIGKSKSKSGKIIVVANYDPAGNMMGDFAKYVHPPKN